MVEALVGGFGGLRESFVEIFIWWRKNGGGVGGRIWWRRWRRDLAPPTGLYEDH